MGKSLQLGSVAGIRLQVHWTFTLVVAWVLLTSIVAGETLLWSLLNVAFVLVLFGCVVLHELGHALAARLFGIGTKDITLLPIGGIARLEQMPRKPVQELIVALAGPAVNVVIAAVLFGVIALTGTSGSPTSLSLRDAGFLQQLMLVNIILVVFNLIPAFPMDGGRVLRACLASAIDYARATRVAAVVGQLCAVGLGLLGLMGNPFLFLIAIFVFFGAAAEARQVELREQLGGYAVRDGMIRYFRAVPAQAPVRQLAASLLDSMQQDYPVLSDGNLVGMLRHEDLLAAVERDSEESVEDIMQRDIRPVDETDHLATVLETASINGKTTLPVTRTGALTGLLDLKRVFQLIHARARLGDNQRGETTLGTRRSTPGLA